MTGAGGISRLRGAPRRTTAPVRPARLSRPTAAALLATAVAIALGFSTLRSRIIDLRYRAADLVREERALEERSRALAVRVRSLRDPLRLAGIARERGFAHPERVIDLAAPAADGAGPPSPAPGTGPR